MILQACGCERRGVRRASRPVCDARVSLVRNLSYQSESRKVAVRASVFTAASSHIQAFALYSLLPIAAARSLRHCTRKAHPPLPSAGSHNRICAANHKAAPGPARDDPLGIVYEDIEVGEGKAAPGDYVSVIYETRLNGKVIDDGGGRTKVPSTGPGRRRPPLGPVRRRQGQSHGLGRDGPDDARRGES